MKNIPVVSEANNKFKKNVHEQKDAMLTIIEEGMLVKSFWRPKKNMQNNKNSNSNKT